MFQGGSAEHWLWAQHVLRAVYAVTEFCPQKPHAVTMMNFPKEGGRPQVANE